MEFCTSTKWYIFTVFYFFYKTKKAQHWVRFLRKLQKERFSSQVLLSTEEQEFLPKTSQTRMLKRKGSEVLRTSFVHIYRVSVISALSPRNNKQHQHPTACCYIWHTCFYICVLLRNPIGFVIKSVVTLREIDFSFFLSSVILSLFKMIMVQWTKIKWGSIIRVLG